MPAPAAMKKPHGSPRPGTADNARTASSVPHPSGRTAAPRPACRRWRAAIGFLHSSRSISFAAIARATFRRRAQYLWDVVIEQRAGLRRVLPRKQDSGVLKPAGLAGVGGCVARRAGKQAIETAAIRAELYVI